MFRIFIENGILHVQYLNHLKIDFDTAKSIVEKRLEVSRLKLFPLLIDAREAGKIDYEARNYFNSEVGKKGIIAAALLVGSGYTMMLGNFFLRITYKNEDFPAKLFREKEKAIKWLEPFKERGI